MVTSTSSKSLSGLELWSRSVIYSSASRLHPISSYTLTRSSKSSSIITVVIAVISISISISITIIRTSTSEQSLYEFAPSPSSPFHPLSNVQSKPLNLKVLRIQMLMTMMMTIMMVILMIMMKMLCTKRYIIALSKLFLDFFSEDKSLSSERGRMRIDNVV